MERLAGIVKIYIEIEGFSKYAVGK